MIKAARKRKGLTQANLAIRLKVTQSYVSKIESANAPNISIKLILDLCNILDLKYVPVFKFLISGSDDCRKRRL